MKKHFSPRRFSRYPLLSSPLCAFFILIFAVIAGAGIPAIAGLAGGVFPSPLLAAVDHNSSRVYVYVDTALADGRDYAELDIMLYSPDSGLAAGQSLFCASSRDEDSVSVGANEEGLIKVTVSSSAPGVSQIAVSLQSQDAAERFLLGEIGAEEARIIQTDKGLEIFPLYFIAGSLNIEYCEMEFDKDSIAVTDQDYSDNAIGTVYLRTDIDHPVANKRVTVHSDKEGILLYPVISSPSTGQGSSIDLVTDRDGAVSFVVRAYVAGDAEIFCTVDGQEFSQFLFIDTAENVFDFEEPEWMMEEEEEEEEERPVISREHTVVSLSKPVGYEHGNNARYHLPVTEDGWDKILISGVAMSADDEPVREIHLVNAYVTAGTLDKSTTLTTSEGGAFSFSLSSADVCMGRYAVGLGTSAQLKSYLEGGVDAEGCQLLSAGSFAFIGRDWDRYMICAVGDTKAVINGASADLDAAPFLQDNRIMLGARSVADATESVAGWDQASQTASFAVREKNYSISMKVGSVYIDRTENFVAPRQYISDVPAAVKDGRTVLPMRALGEAFEMRTIYDAGQQMAAVYNLSASPYDPRLDPDSPLYDPTRDPESDQYIER